MKRSLSVPFGRSISPTSGRPERMEIVVQSLTTSNSVSADTTYPPVDERKLLSLTGDRNLAVFELLPSYTPGLDRPILYRISWRKEFLGRVETTDFTMPNADISYDDLFDLGSIIGNETYLREDDLGVAGRVAKLNADGLVIDARGQIVTGSEATQQLEAKVDQEVLDRKSADAVNRAHADSALATQIDSVLATTGTQISAAVAEFRAADLTEKTARDTAITTLNQTLQSIVDSSNAQIATINTTLQQVTGTLNTKADLVGGKVPTSQIPSIALGTAVSVDTEAQMLALTSTQVQAGDIAIRPDGSWILVSSSPALLSSWKKLSAAGSAVTSVNGQVGIITLGATDVGARPASVPLVIGDITNLSTELAARLTQADLATLNTALGTKATITALNQLRSDAVIKTAGGMVPTFLLDVDVPLVNNLNQLVKKDGTVISTGGGSGAVASVNGQIGTVVLGAGDVGARPVTTAIPQADITGLTAALNAKANQADLNTALGRISALEAAGPGGGGTAHNVVSWGDDGTDNIASVFVHSPFGRTSGGALYYNHLGAVDAEAVWPYVSKGGALSFRSVVQGAPDEPDWARADDLAALTTVVASKATIADLTALQTQVNSKANQSALDSLTTVVGTKATTTALNTLTSTVQTKADQTSVDSVNSALQTKVDSDTFNTRAQSVDQQLTTKYQIPVGGIPATTLDSATQTKITRGDAAKTTVDAATSTGAASQLVKTDGSGLYVVTAATAAGHPYRKDQVDTLLGSKADTTALTSGLAGKADLVGGKIPTGQIPAIATHETYAVANRAAMLALTTTQVQVGDVAIITSGADQGTYTLVASDPTVFGNWLKYQAPPDAVTSINGYTGTVVLAASDVGARSTAVSIPQSDISGLTTALGNKADTTYVNTQVATRTTPTNVNDQIALLGSAKLAVDYVANGAVGSLSGQQSVDGTLTPLDSRVLLPLQSASSQNGFWVVKSGAWIRPTDMPSGGQMVPYALVSVKSGASNADSLWQMTGTGLVTIDTTAQNWTKVLRGGLPIAYTAADASIIIDAVAKTIAAKVGAGLLIDATGIRLDTTAVLRKVTQDVPSGSTTPTITHGLNTQDLLVGIRDKSTNDYFLVGYTAVSLQAVSVEFDTAPTTGQYSISCFG